MITLPDFAGIAGAVYDPEKPYQEQSELCFAWAFMVRKTPPTDAQTEVFGANVRYPYRRWEVGGVAYIEEVSFVNEISHPAFLAYSQFNAKIHEL